MTAMRRTAMVAVLVAWGAGAAGAGEAMRGDALRSTVSGKTLHVSTPIGSVPVSFRDDGTMSGRAQGLAAYAVATADRGRWWIKDDKLCQKWEQWFEKATHCMSVTRDGRKLYWSGGGRTGVATIAN